MLSLLSLIPKLCEKIKDYQQQLIVASMPLLLQTSQNQQERWDEETTLTWLGKFSSSTKP